MRRIDIPYRPHPPQLRFRHSQARWRCFLGGIRSGKTTAGSIEAIIHALTRPGGRGAVISPTYVMSDIGPWAEIRKWMPDELVGKKLETHPKYMRLHNGSEVFFFSAEYPDRIRGATLDWFWIDEGAFINDEEIWRVAQGRLLSTGGAGWITTTPNGYNWLYDTFVERLEEQPWRADDYELITCETTENPHLDQSLVRQLMEDYGDERGQQELQAKFVAGFEGMVYSDFRPDIHCGSIHYDPDLPLYASVDFGWHTTHLLWIQRGAMDTINIIGEEVYKEHTARGSAEATMARYAALGMPKPNEIYYDPAAKGEAMEWSDQGMTMVKADNDITAGLENVRQLMRRQGDGCPGLQIDNGCRVLIGEILKYRYGNNEKPIKERDHGVDAMRYGAMALNRGRRIIVDEITLR